MNICKDECIIHLCIPVFVLVQFLFLKCPNFCVCLWVNMGICPSKFCVLSSKDDLRCRVSTFTLLKTESFSELLCMSYFLAFWSFQGFFCPCLSSNNRITEVTTLLDFTDFWGYECIFKFMQHAFYQEQYLQPICQDILVRDLKNIWINRYASHKLK